MLFLEKTTQIIFESIFTTVLFFAMLHSKCKTYWKVTFTALFTLVYTICFVILTSIPLMPATIIAIIFPSIFFSYVDKPPIDVSSYCALLLLSLLVTRIGMLFSGALTYPLVYWFNSSFVSNKTAMVLLTSPLQMLYVFGISRIPLFKSTIRKWLDKSFSKYIIAICWFLLCLISFLGVLQNEATHIKYQTLLLLGIGTILSFLWIKDEIKKRVVRHQLEEANRQLSAEVHKSKEFLPSIHKVIQKQAAGAVPRGVQTELARMAQEQELETRCALLEYDPVSATGLYLLDEQLADYRREAIDKDVDLFISVQDPVAPLVENGVITQIRLQRLIGDLMRNAFNAIDRRPSGPRGQILLLLGLTADGCYEIDICDNGAPFPAWVLENLGVRGTTTGGTGNGMADIFDTLALCKASFTLQKESEGQLYTKHITISFDGTGRLAIDH